MTRVLVVLLGVLFPGSIWAVEVEGVKLPDQVQLGGESLTLNGAGVRSKFIFDIYVGALYLTSRTGDAGSAITMKGPKRVSMHFLYDEVSAEKLASGWSEGFEKNQSDASMAELHSRLETFNAMFPTVHEGDVISIDFLPGSTKVFVCGEKMGEVPGEDFQRALLAVWLGDKPADGGLKKAMLGGK